MKSIALYHLKPHHHLRSCFASCQRCITTGKSGKESPAAPATKLSPEDEHMSQSEPNSDPNDGSRRSEMSTKQSLGRREDIMKIVKEWQQQLPHESDPTLMFDEDDRGTMERVGKYGQAVFSTDVMVFLQTKRKVGKGSLRRWLNRYQAEQNVKMQRFIPRRHGILGPDLATAHFITFRFGKVKFQGYEKWWEDYETLPQQFKPAFILDKVDATDCNLVHEGIDNLCNLQFLSELNLTNNSLLHVWSFDKLFRQYRFSSTLKKLIVTNCSGFCENSLSAVHRIPSLEEVIITGTRAAKYKHIELLSMMIEDVNPKLKIIL